MRFKSEWIRNGPFLIKTRYGGKSVYQQFEMLKWTLFAVIQTH